MERKRPFVTVKVAESLDGKIATSTGQSQWISGEKTRRWVQRLRSEVDAILVGVNTVLQDDPRLTLRTKIHNPPLKVILDTYLRTPPRGRIFSSKTPVLIAAGKAASRTREKRLKRAGAEILRLPNRDGRVDLKALLRQLAKREITHLLIEGGGEVIASAFECKAVDRVFFVIAPILIGGRNAPTAVEGTGAKFLRQAIQLRNLEFRPLGGDLLVEADVYWDR
jgi:diaminohydroxyphosphoribosylaminopyrimidine deaminase/5-amino-6-(5-phosphoribosylamino)uracil reductase